MWSIKRRHFQWPWTTHTLSFKVTLFFDAEYLRNGTTYRHSVIEILIGTYTRPTQQCHLEWSWVTLSDIAKYSMTRSIARFLQQLSFLFIALYVASSGACCLNVDKDRRILLQQKDSAVSVNFRDVKIIYKLAKTIARRVVKSGCVKLAIFAVFDEIISETVHKIVRNTKSHTPFIWY